jgi:UDP-GlcNAc:undecaprenyl-phosphate GlcNAc-1-phosphate transferase
LAHKKGWIVLPREDRWHKTPTALMGGISIFLSFLITTIISSQYYEINWWILFSFTIMFFIGFIDDLREVKPIVKLLAQVFCAFILISNGFKWSTAVVRYYFDFFLGNRNYKFY